MFYSRSISSYTCIALVMVVVGCHRKQVPNAVELLKQNMQLFSSPAGAHAQAVPSEVLTEVPTRIQQLMPGMDPSEVLRVLGMSDFGTFAMSMGPANYYGLTFELRTNCMMTLYFDMSKRPPAFLSASLNGDGWGDSKQ
jgi:hypothetical protein